MAGVRKARTRTTGSVNTGSRATSRAPAGVLVDIVPRLEQRAQTERLPTKNWSRVEKIPTETCSAELVSMTATLGRVQALYRCPDYPECPRKMERTWTDPAEMTAEILALTTRGRIAWGDAWGM